MQNHRYRRRRRQRTGDRSNYAEQSKDARTTRRIAADDDKYCIMLNYTHRCRRLTRSTGGQWRIQGDMLRYGPFTSYWRVALRVCISWAEITPCRPAAPASASAPSTAGHEV